MLIQQVRFNSNGPLPGNALGAAGHFGNFLQDQRVLHRGGRALAPGKGAVALHQHTGERPRVQAATAELLHDHSTGIGLIRRVDLILRQTTGTGYVAVGKIRVGSAVSRYVPPGLRPRTGPGRMGVGNAPDLRERLI